MELDTPLGTWHNMDPHMWFDCYRTEEAVYYRGEDTRQFHVFFIRGAGFYNYKETVSELPKKSHPIDCQKVGRSYWTHRSLRLTETTNQHVPLSPGYVTYDDLLDEGAGLRRGKAVSDGSVHLGQHVVVAA